MGGPVIMRRLMLLILTLGLVAGQSSKLRYLVAAPAVMSYPSNQTMCVYVMSPEAGATLTITLTAKKSSVVFNILIRKGEGPLNCKTFQVPPPMDGKEEIATLAINITSDVFKKLEKKSVIISIMRNGMFIQTDRPIYQPGETVIVKGVDFNEHLMARNDPFPLVTCKDDQGNIVKQWKNVQPRSGIFEMTHDLSPDIAVGDYTITATKNGSTAEMPFTVEKIVLPKFEVTMDAAETVTILQSNFPIMTCGKYTYGKPVIGTIIGKICRSPIFSPEHICKEIYGKTDVDGCYTTEVNTDFFKFKYDGYNNYVNVEASLVEDGSEVERKATKYIYISDILGQANFKVSRAFSKKGLDYRGEMTLTGSNGLPMADKDIELYVNDKRRDELYTTDKNGIARFIIKSSELGDQLLNLRAHHLPRKPLTASGEREPMYEDGYASLFPSYTKTASQVKIRSEPFVLPCNERVNLWADYVLDASEYTKKTIDFHYLVISFGKIVSSATKKHTISASGGLRSFFPFPLTVTSDMSPAATILMYTALDNGEIIADSIKIPVMSCFPNSVSLQFSDKQSLPGSMVNLHISAYPNSMCSIRAVDKSIELLKAEKERSEDTVNEFLKDWEANRNYYPPKVEELQACPAGSYPVFSPNQLDIYSHFEQCAIKVLTNFNIRKPLDCKLLTTPRPKPKDFSDTFAK
ncbi:alpha-2-macroglobulin-like protein 1 [Eleutherodactylus coqui]|uniref:alpha-2-macroglobulin-like protein 1 n=1 Tax=Eleutherodactylus coqui TaxID=57060 RepID=UPI003462F654